MNLSTNNINQSKIGILALQGAVVEHFEMVESCGAKPVLIKWPKQLSLIDGLIIPGGESTTIGKLMVKYGFIEPIREMAKVGFPIFGTCAGMVLLAKKVLDGEDGQPLLGLIDITVRRNAFGRQNESFEEEIKIQTSDTYFPAIFIRAPWVEKVGKGVEVIAEFKGKIVAAKQGNILVTAFHPELTDDLVIHKIFVDLCNYRYKSKVIAKSGR